MLIGWPVARGQCIIFLWRETTVFVEKKLITKTMVSNSSNRMAPDVFLCFLKFKDLQALTGY